MASKTGARPTGTDGGDYTHRERVASHYTQSAVYKQQLRRLAVAHVCLWLLMLLRLAVPLCRYSGVQPPNFLLRMRVPKALPWEFMWLPSIIGNLFVLTAIRKNRAAFLGQYLLGTLIFGFVPVGFGVVTHQREILDFLRSGKVTTFIFGFSAPPLWAGFLLTAGVLHIYSAYCSVMLISAWRGRSNKHKAN